MLRPACKSARRILSWLTDLPKALAQAKAENKLVLVDFTGSDWCVWCMKLDKDTFSTTGICRLCENKSGARATGLSNNKPQSDDLKAANAALAKKYRDRRLSRPDCNEARRHGAWTKVGYLEGGPQALIAKLERRRKNKFLIKSSQGAAKFCRAFLLKT